MLVGACVVSAGARRFRPRNEWARLVWTLVFIAVSATLPLWCVGWVLAHVSDAIGRL